MFTILEGSTFCICDDIGDVGDKTSGLFAEDTRFLSRLKLTLNGATPLPLSSGKVEYFSAAFFLRNPLAGGLRQDQVLVTRERFVGQGMQDVVILENASMEPVELEVGLEFASDFADIFSVKDHDFALGDPLRARPLPDPVPARFEAEHNQFVLEDREEALCTQILLSRHGNPKDSGITFPVRLEPKERWAVRVDVVVGKDGDAVVPTSVESRFGEERGRVRDSLAAWQLRVPQLRAEWDELGRSFNQSVSDLAALRMRGSNDARLGMLPAAGMPWFMAVFGRDTIIACLQTLLFGPELARNALAALASLQAREDDPSVDAEPGKIVHEVRYGKAAERWFHRYYGTIDATPLYVVLFSELWRWTDDTSLAQEFKEPALRALEWIDRHGDLDGDGSSRRESGPSAGSTSSRGRTPGTHSGSTTAGSRSRRSRPPRRRATSTTPSAGWPRSRARSGVTALLRSGSNAKRRSSSGASTRRSGARTGWVLRTCARRRQEPGRLDLFEHRAPALVADRPSRARRGDRRPAHGRGAVVGLGCPHDVGERAGLQPALVPQRDRLAARQLAHRVGACAARPLARAQRIVQRMLAASRHFDHQLPEVFAGLRRSETPFPIAYPTAARPQAWAAGTPVLLLQLLLGLRPNRQRHRLESVAPPELPHWTGSLRLSGVRAFDSTWDVRVRDGIVQIESA